MDYTVIGDVVNLDSRLEVFSKNYEAKILFNEALFKIVKDRFPCVEIGLESVKGKAEKMKIYGIRNRDILKILLSLPPSKKYK